LAFPLPEFFFKLESPAQDMEFQVGVEFSAVLEAFADVVELPGGIAQVFGHGLGRDEGILHKVEKGNHGELPDYFLKDYRYKTKSAYPLIYRKFPVNLKEKEVEDGRLRRAFRAMPDRGDWGDNEEEAYEKHTLC
jgi:hypothetical protein